MNNTPFAYFLTFRTYATWLHGDSRFSIDLRHNIYGKEKIKPNAGLQQTMKDECLENEFLLRDEYRNTVLQSIVKTCEYNHWNLYAAHVRTNHVHVILQGENMASRMRTKIKIYASKALKKSHSELMSRKKFWSAGGSDRYIWASEFLFPAMHYVIEEQGEKMALYYKQKEYKSYFAAMNIGASEVF